LAIRVSFCVWPQNTNPPHPLGLRPSWQRPRCHRAAKKGDERAALNHGRYLVCVLGN
jgi:hypothetical protein